MMKHAFYALAMSALTATGASASTYILDFDLDSPGQINPTLDSSSSQTVSNPRLITDSGITWIIATDGGAGAALFNTTCPTPDYTASCNDDRDLSPLVQDPDVVAGNVLIQQRDYGTLTPNDDLNTSLLTLTLDSDVELIWTGVSAVDDGKYIFSTSLAEDPPSLGEIVLGADRQAQALTFAMPSGILRKGDKIFIDFADDTNANDSTDSGGIDRLVFSVVPVPAGLPLLVGGLGVFAALRFRKRNA